MKMGFLLRGISKSQILPAHIEKRISPSNICVGDERLFAHEMERCWGPCNVIALENLTILGETWVQWRYLRIVNNYRSYHRSHRRKRVLLGDLTHLFHQHVRIDEVLWVHDEWSSNYFHWLTDVLPKLQA